MIRIKAIFDEVRGSGPLYNRWSSDHMWTAYINHRLSQQPNPVIIKKWNFNSTMGLPIGFMNCGSFDQSNQSGVFRRYFHKSYFYFVTQEGNVIDQPQMNKKWRDDILSDEKSLLNTLTPPQSAAVPVPSPPPSPETPRHSTATSSKPETAKKSTGKRGHPDPRTPPSTEKRRRSIPIPVNMSDPKRNPNAIQAGVKAIQTIKSRAAEPWKKANKRLKGKFDQARDKICELKQAMSQLRKEHKEEKMKDEAELKKAFKTISCLKNKLESCGSAEKLHWYFVFTGVQIQSDLKSQIILTP